MIRYVQPANLIKRRSSSRATAFFLRKLRFLGLSVFGLGIVSPVHAHEYWLSPINYQVEAGKIALIDIRNGEDFVGSALAFDPGQFESIELAGNLVRQTISNSRLGDYPAIHKVIRESGLYTVSLSSTRRVLEYASKEKFEGFLDYHGFDGYAAKHKQLGFPDNKITEHYYRYAKTLVTVVDLKGDTDAIPSQNDVSKSTAGATGTNKSAEDKRDIDMALDAQGLKFEIVMLDNPYLSDGLLRVQLLLEGEPLSERQIEVFHKAESVTRDIYQSDADGIASLTVSKSGEYLVNAVQLLQSTEENVQWETLWASYTFFRP